MEIERVKSYLIVCVWYAGLWAYYWHTLLQLGPQRISGYGVDDITWESTFALTVLLVGFGLGRLKASFSLVQEAKNAFFHIVILGSGSLTILYLTSGVGIDQAVVLQRAPVFTVAGVAAFVSAFYLGFAYRRWVVAHGGPREAEGPEPGAGGAGASPHMMAIVTGIVSSVCASAITATSGKLAAAVFGP